MKNYIRFECYRSALALFLKYLLVFIPVSLFYLLFRTYLVSPNTQETYSLATITLIYRLVCIALAIEMLRMYFNNLYIFGYNRVILFEGRLSLNYRRVALAYKDIIDISLKQNILGRIFDYGTLTFATSSTDGYEIDFIDLSSPHYFITFVQDHIQELAEETRNEINPNRIPSNYIDAANN